MEEAVHEGKSSRKYVVMGSSTIIARVEEAKRKPIIFKNGSGNNLSGLLFDALLFYGNFPFVKEVLLVELHSLNLTTQAKLNYIMTNQRLCLLSIALVLSFCSESITVSEHAQFRYMLRKHFYLR